MAVIADLKLLSLSKIQARCAEESNRYFQRLKNDTRYCLELFRRAFLEKCETAWDAIYQQYRPLVCQWVINCSSFAGTGEDVDHFVNRAFEKFWHAMTPEKFNKFLQLNKLLKYLQTCVISSIIDFSRAKEYKNQLRELELGDEFEDFWFFPNPEREAIIQEQRSNLWAAVEAQLKTEKERYAVYGLFVLGLKPRQVFAEFPDIFNSVQEISRTKENFINRLKRNQSLLQLLQDS